MSNLTQAPRMFPLQRARRGHSNPAGPLSIQWSIAEKAYGVYAQKNGTSQSLEDLASRGGFSICEMDDLYPQWRVECDELTKLRAINNTLMTACEAAESWFASHGYDATAITREGAILADLRAAIVAARKAVRP